MNETRRTVIYVVVAVVSVGLAWWLSPPVEITPKEFAGANLGNEFYPEFKDPNEPTSIRVVSYDEAKATSRVFGVEFKDGKWTIPSHHNYPADGADRLAKTAASAKGIKREEFAGDSKQYHEQLGVIDPLDPDGSLLKGRGQRITLSKGEQVLMDLIVGKAVKDRPGYFYVRKPGEDATYVAKLEIDLSTKFKDWVETDLLKLNRDDLNEIVLDNYSIDEQQGVIKQGEVNKLTRDKPADPWKLAGLDESKEEVDVSKVNGMLAALDDLRLAGVRPKPKGLKPDLTFDEEVLEGNPILKQALLKDMASRGFYLTTDPRTRKRALLSNEGELLAATNKGVVYTLRFGEVFQGGEEEVEVGIEAEKKKEAEGQADEKDKEKGKSSESKEPSRYLFVTANFDASFIGPKPEKPERPEGLEHADAGDGDGKNAAKSDQPPDIKPGTSKSKKAAPAGSEETKPEEKDENCAPLPALGDDDTQPGADTSEAESAAKNDDADKGADSAKPQGERPGAEKSEEDKPNEKPAGQEQQKEGTKPAAQPAKKSKEELQKEYDDKVRTYESDLKTYEDKVTAGKKLADELNQRFADWYYVISAENFNKLHLSRKELVREKAKPVDANKSEENKAKPSDEAADAPGVDAPEAKEEQSPD